MGVFAERLKGRRMKLGITQKAFAKATKVAPGTLSAYERGHKTPTVEVAGRMADALGVTLEWLCGRADAESAPATYGELIRIIDKLVRSGIDSSICAEGCAATLTLRDEALAQIFAKWADILKLLRSKTIDVEIYEPWLEKQISEVADEPVARGDRQ